MDLKVPIVVSDELSDEVVTSTASLDLASGDIYQVDYKDYDLAARGLPWDSDDYEFSCGVLSSKGKDVEFRVDVNKTTGQYSVSATELLEIKVRAAALFAGISGRELIEGAGPIGAVANSAAKSSAKTAAKPAAPSGPPGSAKGGKRRGMH